MEDGPSRPRTIAVNGTELTYVEQGEGEPFVVVHGSIGDYRDWLDLLAPFVERYRVIAYSRRAHYPSPWPDDYAECAPTQHAGDLAGLIDALDLGPVRLFGHSYGGLVSLVYAAQRPDLVRALILGEPPLFRWLEATPEGKALFDAFNSNVSEPARRAFRRGEPEAAVQVFLDGVIGAGAFDQVPPEARAAIMDNAREMRVELESSPETFYSTLTCEDVGRVGAPTLLLTGELSPPMFHRVVDELERCLPEAERAQIPGVSHDLMNPPVFTETVLRFLARH